MNNLFSFRAECLHDVVVFQLLARDHGLLIETTHQKDLGDLGDIEVEIKVLEGHADMLRNVLSMVPDGHVMVDTLRSVPLDQNSLERTYTATTTKMLTHEAIEQRYGNELGTSLPNRTKES